MHHTKSLREFLTQLKAIGDVQEIDTEVDWNPEMGAIARRSMDLRAPAPLFNRIKGIESGFRAFGAPGGYPPMQNTGMRVSRWRSVCPPTPRPSRW